MDAIEKINKLRALRQKINSYHGSDNLWKMLNLLKKLEATGADMDKAIDGLNLPFGMHIFIKGNFSELMEITKA